MRRLLAAAALLSLTACSLPLPDGVQSVRPPQRRQGGGIQVLPPGPTSGAGPVQIVQGFRDAQANADNHHAVARQFLTNSQANTWRDDAEVQVYDPARLSFSAPTISGNRASVVVRSFVIGRIRADGSYLAQPATEVTESYGLQQVRNEWRLSDVTNGLRLTAADRDRAYQPTSIYFVANAPGRAAPHLVPDQVFLPIGSDSARTLVQRLLQGPSQNLGALGGTVTSAFPPNSKLRSVSVRGGVVTVDLDTPLIGLSAQARQSLSAQLVWTLRALPDFNGLRLLSAGASVTVPGTGEVQGSAAWAEYDPDGLGTPTPYLFVDKRRLQSSVRLAVGSGLASLNVDAAALTADGGRLALLEGVAPGAVTVRTGPLRGPYAVAVSAPGLSSPSWGSGAYGLWMVRSGKVVRLPVGGKRLQDVPVAGLPGDAQAIAMSRDGARAALVARGRLYVGRVEAVRGQPQVVGLTQVVSQLSDVTRVAWASSTELVVIGSLTRRAQVVRVAVDGSSVQALNSSGLTPVGLAASPVGLLVSSGGSVYEGSARGFRKVQTGSAPTFPG